MCLIKCKCCSLNNCHIKWWFPFCNFEVGRGCLVFNMSSLWCIPCVCLFTSWPAGLPPCPQAQASHREVGCCWGCWAGCGLAAGHSLLRCQMHFGWPAGRRFEAPCLLLPAAIVARCPSLCDGTTACDWPVVGPTNHEPLNRWQKNKKGVRCEQKRHSGWKLLVSCCSECYLSDRW